MTDLFVSYDSAYILDASAIINIAKNWEPHKEHADNKEKQKTKESIIEVLKASKIFIHAECAKEIKSEYENDPASSFLEFCQQNNQSCVISLEDSFLQNVQSQLKEIYRQQNYTHNAFKHWGNYFDADPWIISFAKKHNCIVVNDESDQKDWRIPYICNKNSIKCINSINFIIELSNTYANSMSNGQKL
jgi:hypothetical protein